jgi:hypothetical protein
MNVRDISITVAKAMRLTDLHFKFNDNIGDGRGWVGDVRSMLFDVTKLKSTGWTLSLNSQGDVQEAVKRKLLGPSRQRSLRIVNRS